MADPYSIGGGGGRAGSPTDDSIILDKPYDLEGNMTPEKVQQLNEMLHNLFLAVKRVNANTATGNVRGPSSAVDGDIALFDGATGKLIKDGNKLGSNLVTGPASATSGNLAAFGDATGKVLIDGGVLPSALPQIVTFTLNTSQIDTLNATPITVLAAPGANKMIVCVQAMNQIKRSAAWVAAGGPFVVRYIGTTITAFTSASTFLTAAGANTYQELSVGPSAISNNSTSNLINNAGLEITMTVDANPGAQTGSLDYAFQYFIMPVTA